MVNCMAIGIAKHSLAEMTEVTEVKSQELKYLACIP